MEPTRRQKGTTRKIIGRRNSVHPKFQSQNAPYNNNNNSGVINDDCAKKYTQSKEDPITCMSSASSAAPFAQNITMLTKLSGM
jgi:hypothetical protein